jgi:hypothetical protein
MCLGPGGRDRAHAVGTLAGLGAPLGRAAAARALCASPAGDWSVKARLHMRADSQCGRIHPGRVHESAFTACWVGPARPGRDAAGGNERDGPASDDDRGTGLGFAAAPDLTRTPQRALVCMADVLSGLMTAGLSDRAGAPGAPHRHRAVCGTTMACPRPAHVRPGSWRERPVAVAECTCMHVCYTRVRIS